MIASCGFLEEELRQCSKEGGVTMAADSVETLGVDLEPESTVWERKEVQSEILAYQQEQGIPEEPREDGGQEVATSGYGASKDVVSSCSGMVPHRKIKLEKADGSSSGKKVQLLCPYSWKHMASKWRSSFPPWPLSAGQKELGCENGITNKRKLG